nr:ninja-family protein MODD isoform X2 [Aegilops tauschii subsp. strangulata]
MDRQTTTASCIVIVRWSRTQFHRRPGQKAPPSARSKLKRRGAARPQPQPLAPVTPRTPRRPRAPSGLQRERFRSGLGSAASHATRPPCHDMCPAGRAASRPVSAIPKVPLPLSHTSKAKEQGGGAPARSKLFLLRGRVSFLLSVRGSGEQSRPEQQHTTGQHQWRPPPSSAAQFSDQFVASPAMEAYSRDLLRGVGGGGEAGRGEEKPGRLDSQTEEVELSLGLSLGGRFGQERRRGEGLARSSSVACIQQVTPAPPALARTSSLPPMAEAEAGNSAASLRSGVEVQPQGSGAGAALNGVVVEPAALPRASLSPPSTGSSDGEGILARTSSLPAGIEDGWRKRKLAETLNKLEMKRSIDRMNSSNASVGEVGENPDEMSEQAGGKATVQRMNRTNVRRRLSGLPPPYQPPAASQGPKRNSALKGTPGALERSLSSAVLPSSEGAKSSAVTTPSSSASVVRAAAPGISTGEQQDGSERPAARATRTRSVADMVRKMPVVYTSGLPNGERIDGFLYQYSRAEEVRIVCVCHGSFLTPAEFVAHAGGSEVTHPMRHIVVNPPSL